MRIPPPDPKKKGQDVMSYTNTITLHRKSPSDIDSIVVIEGSYAHKRTSPENELDHGDPQFLCLSNQISTYSD